MIELPPTIHYSVEGSGEAVVLLNGGLMSGLAWEPVAKALAQHFRVVRLDFRGQLLSPSPPPPELSGHATDVVFVLDQLRIDRAHIVGTSFGALVGIVLAAEHPERVASLVVMTATARMSPEMIAGTRSLRALTLEAEAGGDGGDGGKVLDAIVPGTYSPGWIEANQTLLAARRAQIAGLPKSWFGGLAGLLGALERADPARYLGRIRCPAVVVGAGEDRTFPPLNSEKLAHGIPGATLRIVPGAPHGMAVEQPEATSALLLEILPQLAARAARPQAEARP